MLAAVWAAAWVLAAWAVNRHTLLIGMGPSGPIFLCQKYSCTIKPNKNHLEIPMSEAQLDPIAIFFDAWQMTEANDRLEKITSAVTTRIQYDDPRTPETIKGIDALSEYVGMFSANAPGWTAKVVKSDTINNMIRATVAFGGMGPDGNEMIQYGQYFVEKKGDLISRMVGFVGTGEPE